MLDRLRFCLFLCFAMALCSVGCSSSTGSSGPIMGGPVTPPALTLSPAALTFAGTTVGQQSTAQTATLTNSGAASLSLSSIVLSDMNNYALMNGCSTTLAPAATCTLSITFKPQSASAAPATVIITSNAPTSPQTITLTGTGTAAPVPAATLSPTTVTFPATTPLTTAPAQTVTLTNSGTAALTVSGLALSGSGAAAFALTGNTCTATLAAGSACTVGVTFTPASLSTSYSATLTATDNAGGTAGSTQIVTLSGSGSAAPPVARAVLSPMTLTFPATLSGSTAVQTVTLSNPGTAALTGISLSGTAFTSFTQTSTCTSTLAAGASCNIAVTFSPKTTGNFSATLSVADSATGSPQTVALSGSGTMPQSTLSSNTLSFPNTPAGTSTAAQTVTLSNPGSAPLTISGIALGGTNPTAFAETTTCAATLAPAASCSVTVTYTAPASAVSSSATVTLTTNAPNSPQVITLLGSSPASAAAHTLLSFPEPDLSVTPLYALINGASKTIDMTMYELVDTTFSADLVSACTRGVKVRVILDASLEKSSNTAAYNQLNAAAPNCIAAWSNTQFQATHQKSFIIDGTQAAIMSLNLTSRYYSTTRDFALLTTDPADIAAIETTFNTDFGSTTDLAYQPPSGTDLIWSPTTAQPDLLALINGATKTLVVENEEMGAANIVSALQAACQRGVQVHIAMTDTGSYHANFSALEASGCGVHTYPDTATALYIHAKAMVADFGLPTQQVYMGSINFSIASMTENRELGLYLADTPSVTALNAAMTQDYAGANPF